MVLSSSSAFSLMISQTSSAIRGAFFSAFQDRHNHASLRMVSEKTFDRIFMQVATAMRDASKA